MIVDVHLGGMLGFDLQEELRKRGDAMPVIVISGVESAVADARRRGLGVTDFFRKPFEVAALVDAVGRCIGQPTTPTV